MDRTSVSSMLLLWCVDVPSVDILMHNIFYRGLLKTDQCKVQICSIQLKECFKALTDQILVFFSPPLCIISEPFMQSSVKTQYNEKRDATITPQKSLACFTNLYCGFTWFSQSPALYVAKHFRNVFFRLPSRLCERFHSCRWCCIQGRCHNHKAKNSGSKVRKQSHVT